MLIFSSASSALRGSSIRCTDGFPTMARASAIVGKPSVLLMDEPLSALDAELKISMRKEIQDIHKMTGATIIYVTHDQSEALAMADRIIIMKDGRVEQIGTPQEIYCHPQTEFAATFVSKCNLFKGRWTGNYFEVFGEQQSYHHSSVAPVFRQNGLFPVRPEQIRLTQTGSGLSGTITNKQYNGREIHYSVRYKDETITVYSGTDQDFVPGETVHMILAEQ